MQTSGKGLSPKHAKRKLREGFWASFTGKRASLYQAHATQKYCHGLNREEKSIIFCPNYKRVMCVIWSIRVRNTSSGKFQKCFQVPRAICKKNKS